MCIQIYNNYKERKNAAFFCQINQKKDPVMSYTFFLRLIFIKLWSIMRILEVLEKNTSFY